MRRTTFFLLAVSVVFLGASCAKKSTTTNTQATVNQTPDSATNANANVISVVATGFSPATLTVQKGVRVTWNNESGRTVFIAPDNHPSHTKYRGVWDDDGTGSIRNGETYSFTFSTAGTFTYHDHLNSVKTGTIIVTE